MASSGARDVAAGAKLAVVTAVLVFLISAVQLPLGSPIAYFGSTGLSVAYVTLVYLPVFVVCALAFWRLKRL
jgi:hypothetical protein